MAKKKKKPNLNEKQSRAESYNRFVGGINAVLQKLGINARAQDLPASSLEKLYNTKHLFPKIVRTQSHTPKSKLFREIEYFAPIAIAEIKMELEGFDEEVSLKTFFTDVLDFCYFSFDLLKCKSFKDAEDREKLLKFLQAQKSNLSKASQKVASLLVVGVYTYSDFKKVVVGFEFDEKTRSEIKASPMFNIIANEMEVEQKVFLKDRFNRIGKKAYNIIVGKKPESIKIKLLDLGIRSSKELDVYIQDHVFDRLCERIDAIDIITIYLDLFRCLLHVEYETTNTNNRLIVFKHNGKKLGYITFRILDDAILLNTFLFLTNDSTPEGEKLKELTSLEKEDKKYLKIDRLSAFALSDVKDNPKLVQLFEDADCGHLFEGEYKPLYRDVSFSNIADRMLKYLEREGGTEEIGYDV